jgi:hypothetical protein
MEQEFEPVEGFEAEETSRVLPVGWLILFWGLILFGVVYVAMYTPAFSGWSQQAEYEQSVRK